MALLRALASPSRGKFFICSPSKTPPPSNKLLAVSFTTRQFQFRSSIKCTANYGDNHTLHYQAAASEFARPSEIPWKKELCNTVHLIGIVGTTVEIKHLPSGKAVAWTRLAVKKSASDTSWINLTFWNELAQVAAQHVEKGHQIYVSGRLVSDAVESEEGKVQTYYKVVVQQLNFVQRNSSVGVYDRDSNMTGRELGGTSAANGKWSTGELWQAFFANPSEWWDNRKNKRSPKYPDFKHKDTGEALWIEGKYNPSWVKSQLAILDERMGSLHDYESRSPVSSITSEDLMGF